MSKMSNIDYSLREILEKILIVFIGLVIGFLIHVQDYRNNNDKINNLETRLNKQESYMHQVQADMDNIKEVLDK